MKADQGKPYQDPTASPDAQYCKDNYSYNVFIHEYNVEIFEKQGDNIKQRLVLQKDELQNFEHLLLECGFKQL